MKYGEVWQDRRDGEIVMAVAEIRGSWRMLIIRQGHAATSSQFDGEIVWRDGESPIGDEPQNWTRVDE